MWLTHWESDMMKFAVAQGEASSRGCCLGPVKHCKFDVPGTEGGKHSYMYLRPGPVFQLLVFVERWQTRRHGNIVTISARTATNKSVPG